MPVEEVRIRSEIDIANFWGNFQSRIPELVKLPVKCEGRERVIDI